MLVLEDLAVGQDEVVMEQRSVSHFEGGLEAGAAHLEVDTFLAHRQLVDQLVRHAALASIRIEEERLLHLDVLLHVFFWDHGRDVTQD
eukprot:CAMPEP_0180788840 /NCGR_PEP_ID=MMETSP1038_2-20121128/52252_1 /TAXON_ID=632150 /ORGANISM="Azadinium spinosum, Strain 3D9" /LENGTH=87 /DNA_ID=CAMNT_0022826463 /DNA_START=154 /DNA_END=417 /DNA_ORIENTATION=-